MEQVKCPACHLKFETDQSLAECPDCFETFEVAPRVHSRPEKEGGPPTSDRPTKEPAPKTVKPAWEPKPFSVKDSRTDSSGKGESIADRMLKRITKELSDPERKPARKISEPPTVERPKAEPAPAPRARRVKMVQKTEPAPQPHTDPSKIKKVRMVKKVEPVRRSSLEYIPEEYWVPRGFDPSAKDADEVPIPERAGPRAVRPVKRGHRKQERHVGPHRHSGPRVRPMRSQTAGEPIWKTRSGMAGLLLLVVFGLGFAQAILMLETYVEAPSGSGPVDLTGRVVDENGQKIVGAVVIIDGSKNVTTGPEGDFYIEKVDQGDHTIIIYPPTGSGLARTTYHTTVTPSSKFIRITVTHDIRDVDDTRELGSLDDNTPYFSLVIAVLSAVALIGGVFAIRGSGRKVPIIGALAGLATFGLYLGSILSLVALILIMLAGNEYGERRRCSACTGFVSEEEVFCEECDAVYHTACADEIRECVVCDVKLH